MDTLKLTSWNVEHLDTLLKPAASAGAQRRRDRRLAALRTEIMDMAPDALCLVEGPKGEAAVDAFTRDTLNGEYHAVKAPDGAYATQGAQWIWFLVRTALRQHASLLPVATWNDFAGDAWTVHYWGRHPAERHRHYRHPQVLVLDLHGQRVECIGLHLKSKFVSRNQERRWDAGGAERQGFIEDALKARIKLATEAANVRAYIDRKFEQTEEPALVVMGDFNDGPGKEYFEERYLFFDLISNIQGDVFFARKFLNHALFDNAQHLRWTVKFDDFVREDGQPKEKDKPILLDHILFTQSLVEGALPLQVLPGAGFVEHELHELVNAGNPKYAQTSDHRPVSLLLEVDAP